MAVSVAFFRGINVGGNNMLPMKELSILLQKLGCNDVRTYIQSGNVVFRTAKAPARSLAAQIGEAVGKKYGFRPRVLMLSLKELEQVAARNPFPQADGEPKHLHLHFLSAVPQQPDLERMQQVMAPSERFRLDGKVFYLYTPGGLLSSKIADKLERLLGVDATARNWRTVMAVMKMAQEMR